MSEPPKEIPAQEVRAALARLGWTQRELSERLGVHKNTVSGWCATGGPAWLGVHLRMVVALADLVAGQAPRDQDGEA